MQSVLFNIVHCSGSFKMTCTQRESIHSCKPDSCSCILLFLIPLFVSETLERHAFRATFLTFLRRSKFPAHSLSCAVYHSFAEAVKAKTLTATTLQFRSGGNILCSCMNWCVIHLPISRGYTCELYMHAHVRFLVRTHALIRVQCTRLHFLAHMQALKHAWRTPMLAYIHTHGRFE